MVPSPALESRFLNSTFYTLTLGIFLQLHYARVLLRPHHSLPQKLRTLQPLITHADSSSRQDFHRSLSACFPHDISNINTVRITKLNTQMFHDESWTPIYFEIERSKVKVTSHKKSEGVRRRGSLDSCECWLLLVYSTTRTKSVSVTFGTKQPDTSG